jgi:hypothetical protein
MHPTCIKHGDCPLELVLIGDHMDVSGNPNKPQISAAPHHGAMSWQSFDMRRADARAVRGYALIGRLVRHRRHRLLLSQRQLETLSGVDQTVISRLETGRLRALKWSRFARLVDALGGLGEVDPPPTLTARFLSPAGNPAGAPGGWWPDAQSLEGDEG